MHIAPQKSIASLETITLVLTDMEHKINIFLLITFFTISSHQVQSLPLSEGPSCVYSGGYSSVWVKAMESYIRLFVPYQAAFTPLARVNCPNKDGFQVIQKEAPPVLSYEIGLLR